MKHYRMKNVGFSHSIIQQLTLGYQNPDIDQHPDIAHVIRNHSDPDINQHPDIAPVIRDHPDQNIDQHPDIAHVIRDHPGAAPGHIIRNHPDAPPGHKDAAPGHKDAAPGHKDAGPVPEMVLETEDVTVTIVGKEDILRRGAGTYIHTFSEVERIQHGICLKIKDNNTHNKSLPPPNTKITMTD